MKRKSILFIMIVLSAIVITTACENKKEEKNKKYDYLVLVNKYSQLPDDWEKNVELVSTKNAWDEDIQVEKQAYEQYKKLEKKVNKELEKYNAIIVLDSTYRSVQAQQDLWDEWSKDPEKGIDYVKKYVAVPGYSEHHTGLAIDICLKIDNELVYDNDEMKEQKEIFSVVHKKLADYGFILRYLDGRDDITGYAYEPWHLRYVGSKKIAKEIMDKDITFEEYLNNINDIKEVPEAAKYKIEKTLQEYFKEVYQDKIANSRFNVTKIYLEEEEMNDTIKSLNIGDKDIPFEVTYQLQPSNESDIQALTLTDGEYDDQLGWVKNISRLGILKYSDKDGKYTIEHFGTGW